MDFSKYSFYIFAFVHASFGKPYSFYLVNSVAAHITKPSLACFFSQEPEYDFFLI